MNYRAKEWLLKFYCTIVLLFSIIGLKNILNLDTFTTLCFGAAILSFSSYIASYFTSPVYKIEKLKQKWMSNWYYIKKYSDDSTNVLKAPYEAENERIKALVNSMLQYYFFGIEEAKTYVEDNTF